MTCYQQDRAFKNFRKINNDKKGKTNTRDRNNDLIRSLSYDLIKPGSILPPPPSVFYDPQLQIICCYIARYDVRK